MADFRPIRGWDPIAEGGEVDLSPIDRKGADLLRVCPTGDLFDGSARDDQLDEVFAVMALAPSHTFLVATRHPERMRAYLTGIPELPNEPAARDALVEGTAQRIHANRTGEDPSMWLAVHLPLPNVWLGVVVETQAAADERIPVLLNTPAALRWVLAIPKEMFNPWSKDIALRAGPAADLCGLDWVAAAGETGPDARPTQPDWIRVLRGLCQAAEVPFKFLGWGEWRPAVYGGSRFTALWLEPSAGGTVLGAPPHDRARVHEWGGGSISIRVGTGISGRVLDGRVHVDTPSTSERTG